MFDGLSTQFARLGYLGGGGKETPGQGKAEKGLGMWPNRALRADNFPHAVEDQLQLGRNVSRWAFYFSRRFVPGAYFLEACMFPKHCVDVLMCFAKRPIPSGLHDCKRREPKDRKIRFCGSHAKAAKIVRRNPVSAIVSYFSFHILAVPLRRHKRS